MAQRVEAHLGLPPWILSMTTVLFASAAIAILLWEPRALALALGAGLLAIVSWRLFGRLRQVAHGDAGTSAVATTGLFLGLLAVVPLLAFALLWTGLLLIIGVTWVLHAVGIA